MLISASGHNEVTGTSFTLIFDTTKKQTKYMKQCFVKYQTSGNKVVIPGK